MSDKKIKEAFDGFLRKHDIFDEYYKLFNLNESKAWRRKCRITKSVLAVPSQYISSAFSWSDSPTDESWSDYSYMWEDIVFLNEYSDYLPKELNENTKVL